MTKKNPQPARRGPKPKAAGEKQEQLTIRLSPKLKFGLELLAKAQHRSLSQSVEWALQVGLSSYAVTNNDDTIGEIVEDAWHKANEAERTIAVYDRAPALLSFEEFKACELVERSQERLMVHAEGVGGKGLEMERIFYDFVSKHWPALKEKAGQLASAGKSTHERFIVPMIFPALPPRVDLFDAMAKDVKDEGKQKG